MAEMPSACYDRCCVQCGSHIEPVVNKGESTELTEAQQRAVTSPAGRAKRILQRCVKRVGVKKGLGCPVIVS